MCDELRHAVVFVALRDAAWWSCCCEFRDLRERKRVSLVLCRCVSSRNLLKHHQKCQSNTCPICTPVKQYVQKQRFVNSQHQTQAQARQAMLQSMGNDGYAQPQVPADLCSHPSRILHTFASMHTS